MNIAKIHQQFLISSGVSTDTRKIRTNSIFFALKGDNFNGNKFAEQAIALGASFAIVDEKEYALNKKNYILVKDTLKCLQELASFHRRYLNIPVIAITGSNGKTTTKELTKAVLSEKYRTLATKGNLNNHIGVPLTLLALDEKVKMAIIEMGASAKGEIKELCKIARPDYGYITNFGKAHLEGFEGIEGVIQGKSELYDYLKENKKLIFLNLDDPIQKEHYTYSHQFNFGTSRKANVKIEYPESSTFAEINFLDTTFKSRLIGDYNAVNIAAALCIGLYFKVPLDHIQNAIEIYTPHNNRSQIIEINSNSVILDAYNANPTSMMAALTNFEKLKTSKSKIAILGDMLEIGESTGIEHQAIANFVSNSTFEETYLVGDHFSKVELNSPTVIKFKTLASLKAHLRLLNIENSQFLIKGSRKMKLEEVLDEIREDASSEENNHLA